MASKILVVEDEEALIELLTYNLEKAGYIVSVCADGAEVAYAVQDENPDLVLLDWMLPNKSGIDICRQLRSSSETKSLPIIMLTARSEEEDRIRGLDLGADDYLTKPYSMAELQSRIRAILRRVHPEHSSEVLSFSDIKMDLTANRVHRDTREVTLGPKEFRLLKVLLARPGRVYPREQLLDMVWGHDIYVEDRTVDVHIGRLRKALNKRGQTDPIRTVRSAGYAFDEKYKG